MTSGEDAHSARKRPLLTEEDGARDGVTVLSLIGCSPLLTIPARIRAYIGPVAAVHVHCLSPDSG